MAVLLPLVRCCLALTLNLTQTLTLTPTVTLTLTLTLTLAPTLSRSGLMVADEIISRADALKVASDKAKLEKQVA